MRVRIRALTGMKRHFLGNERINEMEIDWLVVIINGMTDEVFTLRVLVGETEWLVSLVARELEEFLDRLKVLCHWKNVA